MSKKLSEKYAQIIHYFEDKQPEAKSELNYLSPYELIVAVILSAQCTDKRVNMITPLFFKKFPAIEDLAKAEISEIFELIKSCSYPNNKAKNISNMAKMVVAEYNGQIPDSIDELQKLPGVGRKTANVVASIVFDIPAIAVDTHVFRVSNRIGLTKNAKTPLETEKQLNKYIPQEQWSIAHHWLILHGRYVCKAIKPNCLECYIKEFCDFYSKKQIT